MKLAGLMILCETAFLRSDASNSTCKYFRLACTIEKMMMSVSKSIEPSTPESGTSHVSLRQLVIDSEHKTVRGSSFGETTIRLNHYIIAG